VPDTSERETSYREEPEAYRRPKKHKKHAQHGGAWKVAYADFTTAMLALFIVLWVMSQDPTIKQAVQYYFRDPVGFLRSGAAIIPMGKGQSLSVTEDQLQDALIGNMEQEVSHIQEMMKTDEMLQKISDQIVFEVTDEGIRMEMRDAPKFSFFAIGSASVTPELMRFLELLTPEVNRIGYQVVIEGHTDSRQYGNQQNYTNWELSSDRANSVRRAMLAFNMKKENLSEVRAYADTRLLLPKNPLADENRRVSVMLKRPIITRSEE
jgi:chemotaxis protein MotB